MLLTSSWIINGTCPVTSSSFVELHYFFRFCHNSISFTTSREIICTAFCSVDQSIVQVIASCSASLFRVVSSFFTNTLSKSIGFLVESSSVPVLLPRMSSFGSVANSDRHASQVQGSCSPKVSCVSGEEQGQAQEAEALGRIHPFRGK